MNDIETCFECGKLVPRLDDNNKCDECNQIDNVFFNTFNVNSNKRLRSNIPLEQEARK